MQVLHTAAEPPNQGRIILPTMGWIWNSKKALRKIVLAYRSVIVAVLSTGYRSGSLECHGKARNSCFVLLRKACARRCAGRAPQRFPLAIRILVRKKRSSSHAGGGVHGPCL